MPLRKGNISVVYEDDWLLVVNKPPGLLTIPAPKRYNRTLLEILNDNLKHNGIEYRLHPCHRLDQQTSGLIIFAKGKSIQKKMMQEFKDRRVSKTYFAFVKGTLTKQEGLIKYSIQGKAALTHYRVIKKFNDFTLVGVHPLTGRKNQIRIHFKQIGHPLLGEDRFAFRRDFKIKTKRLCLHARRLDFIHPVTGEDIHLEAELPVHFRRFLDNTSVPEKI